MAVSAFKTYSAGEVLTASDLNSSFSQIHNNGEDLGWPATKAKDLNGFEFILDSDGDTSITADTDDQIDFRLGGTDIVVFKTVTSAVNGIELLGSATGNSVDVNAFGTDTNIDLDLVPKGSGNVLAGGNRVLTTADEGSGNGIDADTLDGVEGANYARSNAADTISGLHTHTAIPAFNGGTSGVSAPFTVDSTFVVSNLNADLLDGVEGANFLRSNTSDVVTSGTITFNDNVKIGFGTSNGEGTLYSNGTSLFMDMATAKDFYIRESTTSRFLFDSSTGDFHADGDGYFFSTSVGSDPKLKEDIEPISEAIYRLRKLNGVEFTMKKTGRRTAGVLSTDVRQALPNAVRRSVGLGSEDSYDMVDYNAIVGLLVEAVKELSYDSPKFRAN